MSGGRRRNCDFESGEGGGRRGEGGKTGKKIERGTSREVDRR